MAEDEKNVKRYYHALKLIPSLGSKRIRTLLDHYGTPFDAWRATKPELLSLERFGPVVAEEFINMRLRLDPDQAWEEVIRKNISVVTWDEPDYPSLLLEIHDPPPLFYYQGNLKLLNNPSLAIVGSRKHTHYGQEVAFNFASKLADYGLTIVSGMARGIDSWVHKGALEAGGYTAAVLGCGVDICYPPENRDLKEKITGLGIVLSEFPPGVSPLPQNFPQRNRIISGLSLGTLVIEAAEKSGALITAGFALEQGREVFAVPSGIVSPYSKGCHKLLKDGAKLVETVADILEELYLPLKNEQIGTDNEPSPESITESLPRQPKKRQDISGKESSSRQEETASGNMLLDFVSYEPRLLEEIIIASRKSAAEVHVLLLELELDGKVKQLPGKYFIRI
jgi:DNA processing protein